MLYDSLVIARRDIIRSFRQKSQLYGSVVRPLIWLFLLGNGLRGSFAGLPGNYNYVQYIFPGMLAMNVLFASRMTSFEGFGTINNFLVMPLFFLSGALYPITNIPEWLKILVVVNPVTYSVNMLRGIVLGIPADYLLSVCVLSLFTAVVLSLAAYLFSLEGKT